MCFKTWRETVGRRDCKCLFMLYNRNSIQRVEYANSAVPSPRARRAGHVPADAHVRGAVRRGAARGAHGLGA